MSARVPTIQFGRASKMPKMIPPQGLKEIAVRTERGTKIYKADRSGLINVENPKHAKQMKHEGIGEAGLTGTASAGAGYTCSQCGFGSWFIKCSRCGHTNERIEMDGSSG
jgi:hypothetical protein